MGFNEDMETRLTAAQRKALETLKALRPFLYAPATAGVPSHVKTGVHTQTLHNLQKLGLITGLLFCGGLVVDLAITDAGDQEA